MADALPKQPTAIQEAVAKYRAREVSPGVESKDDRKKPAGGPPPLTLLCLDAVARNFAQLKPNLDELPPRFVSAITGKLPLDIEVTTTSPLVNDEKYWKRMCLEGKRWDNCQVADHGLSWKQLFFERNLAEELEEFGVYPGITRKHEDEMLRPPVDSTHPRWAALYPRVPLNDKYGLPTKERFCCNGVECRAIAIASSPSGLWPSLDRAKSVVPGNLQLYVETFAHAHVNRAAAQAALPPGSDGNPVEIPADPDADCDGNVLREYVSPSVLAEFQSTGLWPTTRGPCLLCLRASELEQLTTKIKASEDYVFALKIEQMLSHIDLELVFKYLPNLSNLHLTYGVKKIGMKYERALFGMKISDAMSLAKCVKATDTLTSLALPCNLLDDDLLRMLMTGLVHNQTITSLDLSHNKITNHGVRLLSKVLGSKSVIMSLNLCDNQIHADGGKYLGRALKRNDSLVDLNIRLNRLDDEGGKMLCEGLRSNRSVTSLNMSSNAMKSETARALALCLNAPDCVLQSVDLSGNRLQEGDVQVLRDAVRENLVLTSLDVRANPDVPAHCVALSELMDATHRNELRQRRPPPRK